jgi:hypothetical protein
MERLVCYSSSLAALQEPAGAIVKSCDHRQFPEDFYSLRWVM